MKKIYFDAFFVIAISILIIAIFKVLGERYEFILTYVFSCLVLVYIIVFSALSLVENKYPTSWLYFPFLRLISSERMELNKGIYGIIITLSCMKLVKLFTMLSFIIDYMDVFVG